MLNVALLDTTVLGAIGSMGRYRKQLENAFSRHFCNDVELTTVHLGCKPEQLARVPARLRMWLRHLLTWRNSKNADLREFDLVHLLDGSFGYVAYSVNHKCVVTTVHDVIPRLQAEGRFVGAPPVSRGARWMIDQSLAGIQASKRVAADSQSTADDLVSLGLEPDLLSVIPLGIESDLFRSSDVSADHPHVSKRGPFLLHLGNNGFYKNRRGAIEVFDQVCASLGLRLVLAGPEPDGGLVERRDSSPQRDRIEFVVDPNHQQLTQLYGSASVFLFPSQYEGFGWPPLEAMACGCPVVSSDAGSLAEVVGRGGIAVEAGSYSEMAAGCERLVRDPGFRSQMIERGRDHVQDFSLEALASRMDSFYRASIGRRVHRTVLQTEQAVG